MTGRGLALERRARRAYPAKQRSRDFNGTYSFWVDENIFYYVPKHKFLGGYFMLYIALNYANGELVASITRDQPQHRRRRIGFCRYVRSATQLGLASQAS